MANRLRALNQFDFTGGLNLRSDPLQLRDNEVPWILNMDIDPRGGVRSRLGFGSLTTHEPPVEVWNPRLLHTQTLSDGRTYLAVIQPTNILTTTAGVSGGEFEVVTVGAGPATLACSAPIHGACIADWGDKAYIACGTGNQGARLDGYSNNATLLTAAGAANWRNDYTSPAGGVMPKANLVAAHAGYLWVANTIEDAVAHPNRVRYSHPNNPEDWAELDLFDIREGGGAITALLPMTDHLLVFKENSIWAIYGYDEASFQTVEVSRSVGVPSQQCVARAENAGYFVHQREGVHRILNGRLDPMSSQLERAFDESHFVAAMPEAMWLGWMDMRLYLSLPWNEEAGFPTDAATTFVWDPSVGDGAWTAYRTADGYALGPFANAPAATTSAWAAATRNLTRKQIVTVEDPTVVGYDTMLRPSNSKWFDTRLTTGWMNAGWPDLKKSWRRPTFIVSEAEYDVQVNVYKDYDEAVPSRAQTLNVRPLSATAEYVDIADDGDPPLYDDGTVYGAPSKGSRLVRGSSIGAARAVQLEFIGPQPGDWPTDPDPYGIAWTLNGIIFKYVPRRLR